MINLLWLIERFIYIFLLIIGIYIYSKIIIKYLYKCKCNCNFKKELKIEKYINKAIENREFEVYLQGKYTLENNLLVGAEALVRWNNKEIGKVAPDKFIPILEENKFIVKLDKYMFEQVCKILQRWKNNYNNIIPISINISSETLKEEYNFIEYIKEMIDFYSIDKNSIEIEITERTVIEKSEQIMKILKEIKELGIKIALDDFGAGYSALNILKSLPIDIVKLDKLFLDKKNISTKGKIVLNNVINMANELGLEVITEGVEYSEQAEFLKSIGCKIVQGYLYCKPIELKEFEKKVVKY